MPVTTITFAVFAAMFMTRLKAILIMALPPEQNLKICHRHGRVLYAARINQNLKRLNISLIFSHIQVKCYCKMSFKDVSFYVCISIFETGGI